MNPWKEGDYLCYGGAEKIAEGKFSAYCFIDHLPSDGAKQRVLERMQLGHETYKKEDLAILNAISFAQMWVRNIEANDQEK